MRICPHCRTAYPAGSLSCTRDGSPLVDAREFADAQADPLVGTTVAGRYEVLGRIGVGGMGTVYRANQKGLERAVALKILKEEVSWDPDTVTRFQREAKAMSLLVHPNTVRVFDFGQTTGGMLYLAMELLEGELLTQRLERIGSFEPEDACRVVQQILASLHEAHAQGIIHRDLKPDNIFLAQVEGHEERVVKVLDFGIAKVFEGDKALDQLETQAGTVFGTPRYMSPEQAQGKKLDHRSDLYSVGVLLYQLLTGAAPFVDDDAVVVMAKHIREEVTPPRRACPDRPIPASLDHLVSRTLEKDPARRFDSADEMVKRLERCIEDVASERDRNTGVFGKFRRSLVATPPVALWSSLGVLGLAAGFGSFMLLRSPSDEAGTNLAQAPNGSPTEFRTEPAPAQTDAILVSVPEGARVYYGDELLGLTPLRLDMRPGEQRSVRVEKAGFLTASAQLVADARPRTVILASAQPEPELDAPTKRRPIRRPPHTGTHHVSNPNRDDPSTMTTMAPDPYERFH